MDIISDLEHNRQCLIDDFQAGKISPAAFAAALAKLQFQDDQGCCWIIGAQSGVWYYHDGQSWQRSNPRRSYPVARLNFSADRRSNATGRRQVVLTLLGMIILVLPLFVLPMAGAAPGKLPPLEPSPRPPLFEEDKKDGGGATGAIYGTITDLSADRPGGGIEVSINGQIVRSDAIGHYSITGLRAGDYIVALDLHGQGTPAQTPVSIYVDGINSVTVDLGYYSGPPPTATPQPPPTATLSPAPRLVATISPQASPTAMPPAGGVIEDRPLVIMGLGLLLVGCGWLLSKERA